MVPPTIREIGGSTMMGPEEERLRAQLKVVSKAKLKEAYDKDFKKKYADAFQRGKDQPIPYRIQWMIQNMKKGDSILDVGCGAGLFVHKFRTEGFNAHGCDISEEAVESAKGNVPEAEFKSGVVEELPYEDNSFDYVTSSQLIEHLQDPAVGIKEMYRVAKKKVLLTTPIQKNLMDETHLHFFDFYSMCKIVKEAVGHDNFTIARVNKFSKNMRVNCFAVQIFKGVTEDEE